MRSQRFECKREGLTIRGRVYGREDNAVKPAVILSHGFLDSQRGTRRYAQRLAERGFVCFTYDFNGGGIICSSDGKSEDMTVFTEKKDLLSVIDYVSACDYVDKASITLMGFSQGGFVSAMTAAEIPAKIKRLVLFFPALCIPDDARKGNMMFYHFDPANVPDVLGLAPMKLGGEYARCVINVDPYELIKGYTGKTLLIHGTADNAVNISYADRAAKVLPDCEYRIIDGGGHGFGGKKDAEAMGYVNEFLKELLV